MHKPEANPTTRTELNGHTQRYARDTTAVRVCRLDQNSDNALTTLKAALIGHTPGDVVSVSLIIRRALSLYWKYVAGIGREAVALEREREAVRAHSRLPKRKNETVD